MEEIGGGQVRLDSPVHQIFCVFEYFQTTEPWREGGAGLDHGGRKGLDPNVDRVSTLLGCLSKLPRDRVATP